MVFGNEGKRTIQEPVIKNDRKQINRITYL